MSRVARKPVFAVFDQVIYKPGCTIIDYDLRLEISDLNKGGIVLYVTFSGNLGLMEVHGRFLDFCIF